MVYTGRSSETPGKFRGPMPITTIGYQRLIDQRILPALPLSQVARIDTRVKGRETQADGTGTQLLFEPRYQPEASFEGDLQFALRYEGVNLVRRRLVLQDHLESLIPQFGAGMNSGAPGVLLGSLSIKRSRRKHLPPECE
jgi:hypothetical protein